MLIFVGGLLLHNLLDSHIQLTDLEVLMATSLFHIRKHSSGKGSITPNRLSHQHSKPPKHESYEARK